MAEAPQIVLYLPGLWGRGSLATRLDAVVGIRGSALARLLARGARHVPLMTELETGLCHLFGLKAAAEEEDLPCAAITYLADGGKPGEHWWIRADPVQLSADRDRVVMLGNHPLELSVEECQHLSLELNELFHSMGAELEAIHARRWYLRLTDSPLIRTSPLSAVLGQDILPHLPVGPAARRWKSVLNEVQMMLHTSNVNQVRMRHGKPVINSLWFSGAGRLPARRQRIWHAVWSNEVLGRGLARWMGAEHSTVPTNLADWLEIAPTGTHLVVLEGAVEMVRFVQVDRWRSFVESIDESWLAPLIAAVRHGNIQAATVYLGDDLALYGTTNELRRWWRPGRALGVWP